LIFLKVRRAQASGTLVAFLFGRIRGFANLTRLTFVGPPRPMADFFGLQYLPLWRTDDGRPETTIRRLRSRTILRKEG